jgi:hypothetical protein
MRKKEINEQKEGEKSIKMEKVGKEREINKKKTKKKILERRSKKKK